MAQTTIQYDDHLPALVTAVYIRARRDLMRYTRHPRPLSEIQRDQLQEAAALLLEAVYHYEAHHVG